MASKSKAKTDAELIAELRTFHHYEAARRLEQLAARQAPEPEQGNAADPVA